MDPLTLLLAASVFTLIGVIAGIATGLIPGLHVNKTEGMKSRKVWVTTLPIMSVETMSSSSSSVGSAQPKRDIAREIREP